MTDPSGEPSLGTRLRHAREAANLAPSEVATALRLKLTTIHALESDSFDRLPAPTFVRGYLRGYARVVGIPSGPLLELYQMHGFAPPPLAPELRERRQAHTSDIVVRLVTYAIGAGLVLLVVLWWRSQDIGLPQVDLFGLTSDSTEEASDASTEDGERGGDSMVEGEDTGTIAPDTTSRPPTAAGEDATGVTAALEPSSAGAGAPVTMTETDAPATQAPETGASARPAAEADTDSGATAGAASAADSRPGSDETAAVETGPDAGAGATTETPSATDADTAAETPSTTGSVAAAGTGSVADGNGAGEIPPAAETGAAGAASPAARADATADADPVAGAASASEAVPADDGDEPVAVAAAGTGAAGEPDGSAAGADTPPAGSVATASGSQQAGADDETSGPAMLQVSHSVLVLEFAYESWVEVYDRDRSRLFFGLVPPGRTLDFTGPPPFDVLLGYAKDARVTIDGEPFDHTQHMRHGVARFRLGASAGRVADTGALDRADSTATDTPPPESESMTQ